MRTNKGFTLIELMITIAVIGVLTAIAIPALLASQRAANERDGSGSLKTIVTAEMDFRANDRDNNGVNDFWTADVRGLYTITDASGNSIKLVEEGLAQADFAPSGLSPALPAGLNPSAKGGYRHQVLTVDENGTAYADATGHNLDKFGLVCVPDVYGTSGNLTFVLNEEGTMYKLDTGGNAIPASFPDLPALVMGWSKMD